MKNSRQMPDEYRTGRAVFCGREFTVNPDVLIPRRETEEIIPLALDFCHPGKRYVIADVGTGSGCMGITLALELARGKTGFRLYLSDISRKALALARRNARYLIPASLYPSIVFLRSNLLADYPVHLLFDLVLANLPYIPSRRFPSLPPSVKDFEPRLALDGGERGLRLINRLLQELPTRLAPGGRAILEIDDTHTLASFPSIPGARMQIRRDRFRRRRFLLCQKC
jgi:release factor glutamine methyltransferase